MPDAKQGRDDHVCERHEGSRNLVFVSDGTLSSSRPRLRTNAGIFAALLAEAGHYRRQMPGYDRGVQGQGWERLLNAASGLTINLSILRGYAFLACRYRPGDRIFLFGYSRGAYAMRSLAGMIGQVGLLRAEHATERNIAIAFRHYEANGHSRTREAFRRAFCHKQVAIEMLGLWDTVAALGLPYPGLSRLAPMATEFHDHALGPHIRHGYHALALDEDRRMFRPILWRRSEGWMGRLEQGWFPGSHADVGGEVKHFMAARPLANVPLNWMLRRAHRHGLILPKGWDSRFPEDVAAPSAGTWRSLGRALILRHLREVGNADGEFLHPSVEARMAALPGYMPRQLRARLPRAAEGGAEGIGHGGVGAA